MIHEKIFEEDFKLDEKLWEPQARSVKAVLKHVEEGKDVCLQSPTGSGKTRMASELLRYAHSLGVGSCFYVNRKILIGQTSDRLSELGIPHGIRAADYEDMEYPDCKVQICSADTERSRVFNKDIRKRIWDIHPSKIIIVDEAHIQKGETMKTIIKEHKKNGAKVVLLSATPVSLAKSADVLVSGGTLKEYRDCGALVPAIVRSIEQPDMSKVKRTLTGEFDMGDRKRKIYTQSIVGNVIDRWRLYNPDGRPTMLYAPGKQESIWFTQQFENAGVRWCHVDATDAWLDGGKIRLGRTAWEDIIGQYIDGKILGISSRFKLREGVDVPSTFHVILATPIGSIQSYLQTVGRALRASPGKEHALITDHGGNYLRHGSPNLDRDWDHLWTLSSSVASKQHEDSIRNKLEPEPIRCPECEAERLRGPKCPQCGHESRSKRIVIQEDGKMVVHDGDVIPRKRTRMKADTQTKWNRMYWGYRRKGLKKSFSQLEAYFVHVNGYYPPRTLENMPKLPADWTRYVKDVHVENLITKEK